PHDVLFDVLSSCGEDKLIPAIVWQNLHPLLEDQAHRFLRIAARRHKEAGGSPNLVKLLPFVAERILGSRRPDPAALETLFTMLTEGSLGNPAAAQRVMAGLRARVQSSEIQAEGLRTLSGRLLPRLRLLLSAKEQERFFPEGHLLAAALGDAK